MRLHCICDILQDSVYKDRRLPFVKLQDLKETITMERDFPLDSSKIQCTMEKTIECSNEQNDGTIQHIFRKFIRLLRDFMYFDALG